MTTARERETIRKREEAILRAEMLREMAREGYDPRKNIRVPKARQAENSPSRGKTKILSPRELQLQQARDREEVASYNKENYRRSRLGRFNSATDRFFSRSARARQNLRTYGQERRLPPQLQRRLMFRAMQQAQAQRLAAARQRYNEIFCNYNVAAGVEAEVTGSAGSGGGVAWEGSKAASDVGREVSQGAHLSTPIPTRQVEIEALMHAHALDFGPAFNIEREVLSFAFNPLGVQRRRPARGRRK